MANLPKNIHSFSCLNFEPPFHLASPFEALFFYPLPPENKFLPHLTGLSHNLFPALPSYRLVFPGIFISYAEIFRYELPFFHKFFLEFSGCACLDPNAGR